MELMAETEMRHGEDYEVFVSPDRKVSIHPSVTSTGIHSKQQFSFRSGETRETIFLLASLTFGQHKIKDTLNKHIKHLWLSVGHCQ